MKIRRIKQTVIQFISSHAPMQKPATDMEPWKHVWKRISALISRHYPLVQVQFHTVDLASAGVAPHFHDIFFFKFKHGETKILRLHIDSAIKAMLFSICSSRFVNYLLSKWFEWFRLSPHLLFEMKSTPSIAWVWHGWHSSCER